MYYKSRWNHIVIQQGVFSRLKITYYIASFFHVENLWSIWFSDSQFLEKMEKLISRLPKRFANWELRTANSNRGYYGDDLILLINPNPLCALQYCRQVYISYFLFHSFYWYFLTVLSCWHYCYHCHFNFRFYSFLFYSFL